jgi:hypothetical protein
MSKRHATGGGNSFFCLIAIAYAMDRGPSRRTEVYFFYTFSAAPRAKDLCFQVNARCGHRIGFLSRSASAFSSRRRSLFRALHESAHDARTPPDTTSSGVNFFQTTLPGYCLVILTQCRTVACAGVMRRQQMPRQSMSVEKAIENPGSNRQRLFAFNVHTTAFSASRLGDRRLSHSSFAVDRFSESAPAAIFY